MSSEPSAKATNGGYAVGDLAFVVLAASLTLAAVLQDWPTVVRLPLGTVAVLFLPGYGVTAALYPAGDTVLSGDDFRTAERSPAGITLLERVVLSVASSIAAVVLSGLAIHRILGKVTTDLLLGGVLTITVVSVWIAMVRRRRVRLDERYAPSVRIGRFRQLSKPDLLVVLLAGSILFAGGAVAHTELGTDQSASLTELYFVSDIAETEDGERYQTTFTRGTEQAISLAVGNSEGTDQTYTVVGQLQQIDQQDGTFVVTQRTEISRDELSVAANETERLNTTVEPEMDTGDYRLVYLLYRGEPPENPEISNAYREVHLWITITEPTEGLQ